MSQQGDWGGERGGLVAAQREAVTHRGGPLLVLGAAGSGKTRVIGERFLWLVDQGIEPERVAVIAPSAGRATLLRERIESALARGYEQLFVLTPVELAGLILSGAEGGDPLESVLGSGDRLAMLVQRIDELSLQHHDFGGNVNALLGGFVRRIDRCIGGGRPDSRGATNPRLGWSASSPRCTARTSECWPRRGPAMGET